MYAGHSSADGRIQPLHEHLTGVSCLAGDFAKVFGAQELAALMGLCHDVGKYSNAAQNRLLRGGAKVDHSTAGGKEIQKLINAAMAYPVLGHHAGLPNGGSSADHAGESTLYARLKRDIADYSAFSEEVQLKPPKEPECTPLGDCGFSVSVLLRMLFSCLVDADFIDTETFMHKGQVQRGGYDSIPVLQARMKSFLDAFPAPNNKLNHKRSEILANCLAAAGAAQGLFSLTVPTGGGKTISSLAFALNHAAKHGLSRIIYVIPYTSIIEQNAAVFADILGAENILEHHSGIEYYVKDGDDEDAPSQKHLSTENWDAPVIVTTNVQFFESLFAARTSKCRKLHNIANSVIIFDEAQMIPLPYLHPSTRMIAELVYNYHCTAVLCSATQPALDDFFPKEIARREICDNPPALYEFFRRTCISHVGPLSDGELAHRFSTEPQVLCIVSTRKQAQNLYNLLEPNGKYHLSTLMYPEHRKTVLAEIRRRLQQGLPCRVVATSLIEAGVDVDFPTVYRAQTGLDSVIQAAGRCNREGKRPTPQSCVYVFEPDPSYFTPLAQRQLIEVFSMTVQKHQDVASLGAIHAYFKQLYAIKGDALDIKRIVPRLEAGWGNGGSFPFRDIAKDFKLIETKTHAVLVPLCEQAQQYANRLRGGERSRALLRSASRFSVNVYDNHYWELAEMGIIEVSQHDGEIAILADKSSYSEGTGLTLTPQGGTALHV